MKQHTYFDVAAILAGVAILSFGLSFFVPVAGGLALHAGVLALAVLVLGVCDWLRASR